MTEDTGGDRPFDLHTEYEMDPTAVEPDSPRLEWRMATGVAARAQTAYRVLVARTPERLAAEEGDAWDSGVVESSRSTGVAYDGTPLAHDETYHWVVRLRDEDGAWTPWSEPATFGTAPDPTRFDAEWVGHQPGPGDSNGYRSRWRPADRDATEWVQVDLGEQRTLDAVELMPADPFDGLTTPDGYTVTPLDTHETFPEPPIRADGPAGFGFPVRYRVEVADDPSFEEATVVADRTDDPQPNPAADAVTVDADGATGRYLRVTAVEPYTFRPDEPPTGWPQYEHDRVPDEFDSWSVFALAALAVRDAAGRDCARGRPVTASSSVETETWGRETLVDGAGAEMAATAPRLRTEFDLAKPVAAARLHVATLGWGETHLNGERVGDAVLDPGWTQYGRRTLFRTYDVGDRLREGRNAVGVWLGRGWFAKSFHAWTGYGSPRCLLQVTVEFEDGTTTRVGSGPWWRAAESPVVENDVYDGETYDARREQPGWADPDFDDADWDDAVAVDGPGGDLEPQRVEPVRVTETVAPDAVEERDGDHVIDFGQNLAGWVELAVEGADRGREITLRHAEARDDDGDIVTVDLRSADATDTYVAAGRDRETYEPRFTYHGFRYAAVENYPGDLDPADVTAKVVNTGMAPTGAFACSDERVERIQHAARWAQRSNSMSVPTDCPQRDERAGWGGDTANSGPAWMYNFDAVRFFEKWLRDHADEQSPHGYTAASSPHMFGSKPSDPSWPLTRVVYPWYLYQHYGDRGVLAEQYEGMRRYVAFWDRRTEGDLLPREEGTYGDWLAFENTGDEIPNVGEPVEFFNNTTHYLQTSILAEAAAVLGHDADARGFRERAEAVREAFNDRFFRPGEDRYEPGTQASYCLPLYLGLAPDGYGDALVENLVAKVESDGRKLKTGFLSTRALLFALADGGHADLAYHLVTQPEVPGWGYMVDSGATTMWEHWDSDEQVGSGMNSLNHHQFSLVSEWLYEVLAGVRSDPSAPGFAHVEVAPSVVEDLDWVRGAVETRRGEAVSRWERTDVGVRLDVTVPWNATATLRVPEPGPGSVERVEAAGETVWSRATGANAPPAGVTDVARDGRTLELAAGEHAFDVRWD